jgi:hypothetical protein
LSNGWRYNLLLAWGGLKRTFIGSWFVPFTLTKRGALGSHVLFFNDAI